MSFISIKDFLLPAAVVAVVGMMIFPLPLGILDVLLVANISFALLLLVSTVYLRSPESFTSLPTLLLLTTMFRLGLNISTTRQLLSEGVAPGVVNAFGQFVVHGNLVVGVVVFSIVTLVQFLVIAKGAERVAEVAARFTLDAMPGKQMAIDADIRSGLLSLHQGKELRQALQRESKLFGALDGSMKFVKGDAIAGLVITLVNIVAGFIVGVSQHGMSVANAISTYTIFTIGDGLVSQIPALLVAVSAGIAVTRVSDKDEGFVGAEVFSQLSAEPQALVTASVVLVILSCVPGLPVFPLLMFAVFLLITAAKVKTKQVADDQRASQKIFQPKVLSQVVLRLSPAATLKLQEEGALPDMCQSIRSDCFDEMGVILPDFQFDVSEELVGVRCLIVFHGLEVAKVVAVSPSDDGVVSISFGKQIAARLRETVKERLSECIDDTQTRMLLNAYQPIAEDVINSVVPEVMPVTGLTTILRQLVLDGVAIKDFPAILQAISEVNLSQKKGGASVRLKPGAGLMPQVRSLLQNSEISKNEIHEILAEVRIALRRTISQSLIKENDTVPIIVVNSELDVLLSKVAITQMPLTLTLHQAILDNVKSWFESESRITAIVTSKYARGVLSAVLQGSEVTIPVVAIDEICSDVKLDLLGEISLEVESQKEVVGEHS